MSSVKILIQVLCFIFVVRICHGSVFTNKNRTRINRQINGCMLPEYPEFGTWTIYQQNAQLFPGQVAPLGTVLNINCRNNRKLDGEETIVCIGGKWTKEIGRYLKTCPARRSTSIMTVTCTHNERKLENCTEAVDGTIAKFQCADFYEDQSLERHPVHICFNGKWSHNLPECVPVCGKKSVKENPTLIVGGGNATRGDYPWQVALYNTSDKILLCGGSLLNQKVILTAAHCITDDNGKLQSKELYTVAVGKYFRNYYDHRDSDHAQFSPIHEMYVPKQYKGSIQNFFGDVAILISKKAFVLSNRVQPVCIDWGFKYHHALLDPTRTTHGYVTGWGFTVEHKKPSEVLKEVKVPLVTEEECSQKIPEDYEKFLTDDKLCAGFLDTSTSVCKGDSGGGLVTKYANRFYVIGVVSVSPQAPTQEGGCDSQQYAMYTRVSYYVQNFIMEKEARYRPTHCSDDIDCETSITTEIVTTTPRAITPAIFSRSRCILPEHPISGGWSIFGTTLLYLPGMNVSTGTILKISCEKGFKCDGNEFISCNSGTWVGDIGQCLKTWPSLRTDTTEIACTYKNKELKDCSEPLDGTVAKYTCAPFYENLQLTQSPIRLCSNGKWDLAIPECVAVCGQKSVSATTLIINGTVVNKGDYPWQAALYGKKEKTFKCSGSLINQRAVLTAAHCVSDYSGNIKPIEDYVVVVGKYYYKYSDSRDSEAQFSELKAIYVPDEYSGVTQYYLGDIAILITKTAFIFSRRVQPICLDTRNVVNPESNEFGFVTGWGYTAQNYSPSIVLKELKVPAVSVDECRKSLPGDYTVYLTGDKMCAGYFNQSTSLCIGDSGAGLVFKYNGRYYIIGVASIYPFVQGVCNSQQYTLYTKVSQYMNTFILQKFN